MKSTERFTDRVKDYVQYRPSYPAAVLDLLGDRCGLQPGTRVADVGSGTGILTSLLLERGAEVWAIEPNAAMRAAAENDLESVKGFHSVNATAEVSGLPEGLIDLYTASQAFHWFDGPAAREECLRILKPGSWAALIWNERLEDATPFLRAYEVLLKSIPDYTLTRRQELPEANILTFLAPGPVERHSEPNRQVFDWEGLLGRAASSSYFPRRDSEEYQPTVDRLRVIFEETSHNGEVELLYTCEVFLAQPRK